MDQHAAPYHDNLTRVAEAGKAQEALFARNRRLYDAWYTRPLNRLDENTRAEFAPEAAAAVREVEDGAALMSIERGLVFKTFVDCMLSKASALGAASRGRDEPSWVLALADLQALRRWRASELDGKEVHMAPLFLRNAKLDRKPDGPLFDRCVRTWAKAAGVNADALRDRVAELADAGLLPGVEPVPGTAWETRLAGLVERDGAGPLLAEMDTATSLLDADAHPQAVEALDHLRAHAAPSP